MQSHASLSQRIVPYTTLRSVFRLDRFAIGQGVNVAYTIRKRRHRRMIIDYIAGKWSRYTLEKLVFITPSYKCSSHSRLRARRRVVDTGVPRARAFSVIARIYTSLRGQLCAIHREQIEGLSSARESSTKAGLWFGPNNAFHDILPLSRRISSRRLEQRAYIHQGLCLHAFAKSLIMKAFEVEQATQRISQPARTNCFVAPSRRLYGVELMRQVCTRL